MANFEIDEILNMAIMTKTAHVLVEGVDDVAIYEDICSHANVGCEVFSIEMIDGFQGGCDSICKALDDLHSIADPSLVEKFVVGIVDRDAGHYRNSTPTKQSLFVLKNYSIESHFVSQEVAENVIRKITKVPNSQSLMGLVDVKSEIQSMQDLYYFSLEALRGAVDSTYNAEVGFSDAPGRRKDTTTISKIYAKSTHLDAFANSLQLTQSYVSMKEFIKGKWILVAFSEWLYSAVNALMGNCKQDLIPQCKSCSMGANLPCFYKVRPGFSSKTVYELSRGCTQNSDLLYIKEKMQEISASARNTVVH